MSKLSFLIATPRAGKNTYCDKWMKEKDPDGLNRVVLSGDDIRMALYYKRYIDACEPFVHEIYRVMTKSLLLQGGHHVMLNDTHTSIFSIEKVFKLDKNAQFIYIPTPPDVCKQRAIDTGQEDLFPVIDRMYKQLQKLAVYAWDDCSTNIGRYDNNGMPTLDNIRAGVEKIRRRVGK